MSQMHLLHVVDGYGSIEGLLGTDTEDRTSGHAKPGVFKYSEVGARVRGLFQVVNVLNLLFTFMLKSNF